jgi:hypothetical protein
MRGGSHVHDDKTACGGVKKHRFFLELLMAGSGVQPPRVRWG